MGKSYRYDPEAKVQTGKKNLRKTTQEPSSHPPFDGWDWKKGCIDVKWAISKMAKRVSCVVSEMIRENLICEGEREDYIAKYNEQLVKFAGKYDPTRVGKNGKTASPLHYLRIVESGLTSNIRDYASFRREHGFCQPIAETQDEANSMGGAVTVDDPRLSDGCKNVKDLILRMDIKTLEDMLNKEEQICLSMRLEGYTQDDIAIEIGKVTGEACDRDHVRKVVIVHLQAKARKCGFSPRKEG